ncbi:MAG: hypothetical protein QOJ79_2287 [Actinomycetota bacterium]|nr:hypothetical protein [Actinomycetota bacterium]
MTNAWWKRVVGVAVGLVLVAGCGLPLGGGVRKPGQVPAEERQGGDIQVLPPGPRDDALPADTVRDFFGSQSSPDAAHASAREFLAPEERARWRDNAPVGVLSSAPLEIVPVPGQSDTFRVTGSVGAEVAADGSYNPGQKPVDLLVRGRKGPHGRWLITDVPNGLLLSAADFARSFRARSIYFLAPPPAPGAASSHVVADQVFLPVTADNADGLVRRLIRGPSRWLGDSVQTAFPPGTAVRSVHTNASGMVTVDLTEQVGRAREQAREQMSAQLVWTLRGSSDFSSLRLLSAGRAVSSGTGDQAVLRDRNDWQPYDPDGLSSRPPLYYISGRRLRQLENSAPATDTSQQQVVDSAAASPRGGGLALISRSRFGAELRTGPPTGPFVLRARARTLSFPSWGSGEQGVWYLQNGRVMLAALSGHPIGVPVDGLAGLGPITGVRVSRDGARVGLIVGAAGRLRVGRVAVRNGQLRIVGVRSIAPGLAGVHYLSWDSATSLVVLGTVAAGVTAPVRVVVDGSSVDLVARVGLERAQPSAIAAAPKQPLVVAALFGGAQVIYQASGLRYVRERGITGAEPFYPG